MSLTDRQREIIVDLFETSEIDSEGLERLLDSGRLHALVEEFTGDSAHPKTTIMPIRVPVDYTRALEAMRIAARCEGYANPDLNDENFPVEAWEPNLLDVCFGDVFGGERQLFLVCFHRKINDDENPAKSELLRELDKLGLQPEGPPELCAVGEHHPILQREFSIAARRQVWRDPRGRLVCPVLYEDCDERRLSLFKVDYRWNHYFRFLASRKPLSK